MKIIMKRRFQAVSLFLALWLTLLQPVSVWAQAAVDANGNPTGAPACTGAGCGQGTNQGVGQGANQGSGQGTNNSVTATNTATGANSNNTTEVTSETSTATQINNQSTDTNTTTGTASTGDNTSSSNTGAGNITTGNAGVGVTQVINDNTTTVGGSAGLNVTGYNGAYTGDLNLGFGATTASLAGPNGGSIQAVNNTTGSGSSNNIIIDTLTQELLEIQNDGQITNDLDISVITGQNTADKNTGGGIITTGDANVAATLVNLLNSSVINGNLWVSVADIFGALNGNIVLPNFSQLAASLGGGNSTIDAGNTATGNDSNNTVTVDTNNQQTTTINNDATIKTVVNASAITGQNDALSNTGGGAVTTGHASVSASNISLANTTVEGGNWGLVVVNALNKWLGFLVGDDGHVQALSQEETLQQIEAQNQQTGEGSNNTINVDQDTKNTTTVTNDAEINTIINADAITGQNDANKNTGAGTITTGNAQVKATAVNIANTTVKNGSLFIAVVNIFGDWFGDLMYGGSSLAASTGPSHTVAVNAENSNTGNNSDNTVNVDINNQQTTTIDNQAKLTTNLNATIDTGSNRANKNTGGANIQTGDGVLALHARAAANLTALGVDPALNLIVNGLNDTTGVDSKNKINVKLNDKKMVNVTNDANISTVLGAAATTGNNEASENTNGGFITTGAIAADVAIENVVNRVLLALAGSGTAGFAAGDVITLDANLINQLTGVNSTNSNTVTLARALLIDIINKGLVDNLVNLILTTGANAANKNTAGGKVVSGSVCANGSVDNQVNSVSLPSDGTTVTIQNTGTANNTVNTDAATGMNQASDNTTSDSSPPETAGCPQIAMVPPSPVPSGNGGVGGGEVQPAATGGGATTASSTPKVAAAITKPGRIGTGELLRRFPVAGINSAAQLLPGHRRSSWLLFALASLGLLGGAWVLDKRARQRLAVA